MVRQLTIRVPVLIDLGDDDTATVTAATGISLGVPLAEACPFAELLFLFDLDQRYVLFATKSSDQLLVVGFIAVVSEESNLARALVEGLGSLVESPRNAVHEEGLLQDTGDSLMDVHFLLLFLF